jgi:hypothetical protein
VLTEPDEELLADVLIVSVAEVVPVSVWTAVVVCVGLDVCVAVRLCERVAAAVVEPVRRGVSEPDEDTVEVLETLTVRECVPDVEAVLDMDAEDDAEEVCVDVRVGGIERDGVPVPEDVRVAETVEVSVRVPSSDDVDVVVPVPLFVAPIVAVIEGVRVTTGLLDALRLLGAERVSDAVVVLVRVAEAVALVDFVDDSDAAPVGTAVGVRVEVAERVEHAVVLGERVDCIDCVDVGEADADLDWGAVRVVVGDTIGVVDDSLELVVVLLCAGLFVAEEVALTDRLGAVVQLLVPVDVLEGVGRIVRVVHADALTVLLGAVVCVSVDVALADLVVTELREADAVALEVLEGGPVRVATELAVAVLEAVVDVVTVCVTIAVRVDEELAVPVLVETIVRVP